MRLLYSLMIALCLSALSACDIDRHEMHDARQNLSQTIKLHHLHMLINHSLQMATQGADMNLQGIEHGPAMLVKASGLLERAMTGPEMASMHKFGGATAPLMKMTHELAARATTLIEAMKKLSTLSGDKGAIRMLNHAVEVAATGSSLIMLGQQGMAGDIDAVMVNHGQMMLGEASGLLRDISGADEYRSLVADVVNMLIGIPDMPVDQGESQPQGG
ncbi:hypothetical protein Ga0123462_0354 [Mariprofundus ferrinatatus]|uniref:DUF305 domain-containing protein n=1 Tax=Mariprofundus ferrinatatus TaxID=1921087 RepID=A0A2K8L4R8_9PROT|nr:hypothetical protein [Mariprofundus ferrinatatus]ATX81229.1 hypothetical protein Ga0123462_0354 [Mariprofundus ferrinatatus]